MEFALGRNKRSVTSFAHFQILHIVGDLPIEKVLCVRADQTKPPATAQVDYARTIVQRGVFCLPITVMSDDFLAIDLGEDRAGLLVKFVQERSHRLIAVFFVFHGDDCTTVPW